MNKFKNSNFFGFSPALLWENIKIRWYLPVITFILYFVTDTLPLFNSDRNSSVISNIISCKYVDIYLYTIFAAFFISVITLSSYHNPKRALVLTGQPFSRSKYINSQILIGYIMFLIPIVLTALFFILLKNQAIELDYETYQNVNIYTIKEVLIWFIKTLSIFTYFYGLFTFFGLITGNAALHVIMSGLSIFICSILSVAISAYCDAFMVGYVSNDAFLNGLSVIANPIFMMLQSETSLTVFNLIIYALVGILLIFIGKFILLYAKYEKIGDGFIFKALEELTTWVACFVGMTVGGFAIILICDSESKLVFHIGMILGILIAFFLTKLVIHRTAKIFTKKNLKSFIIFLIIAAIFSSVVMYDVFKIMDKMPDKNEIDKVEISSVIDSLAYNHYNYDIFGTNNIYEYLSSSDETISNIYDLQSYLIENKLYIKSYDNYDGLSIDTNDTFDTLNIIYILKNGKTYKRTYSFYVTDEIENKINQIINTEDYGKVLNDSISDFSAIESVAITLFTEEQIVESATGKNLINVDNVNLEFDMDDKGQAELFNNILASYNDEAMHYSYSVQRHSEYNASIEIHGTTIKSNIYGSLSINIPAAYENTYQLINEAMNSGLISVSHNLHSYYPD